MKGKSLNTARPKQSAAQQSAKDYEELALSALRQAGYRITMPRVQVIRALADTQIALSAYAIHEKIIGSGGKIDVVSVYRILSTLQEVGLIHHIGIVDGYFPCRLADCANRRSQVLVEEGSGNVTEFQLSESIISTIEKQLGEAGYEAAQIKVEISATSR